MESSLTARQQIMEIGRRLDRRGFIAGSDGNISARLDDHTILITPSGVAKGRMSAETMITVALDGRKLSGDGRPSSEMAMHLSVYRARPDISACVHAHPPYATAFAVAGRPLDYDCLPEVIVFVGPIAMTEYAPPGTEAVPHSLTPYVADHNAFLLRNHGLLTLGRNLEEAFNRLETVEQYAKICHLASQLGAVNRIPKEDYHRLVSLRQTLNSPLDNKPGER